MVTNKSFHPGKGASPGGTVETDMKIATCLFVAGSLLGSAVMANAQGVSNKSPGIQMQEKGSVKGSPGASGYAPGHLMHQKGSVKGTTGASGYAPGSSVSSRTDVRVGMRAKSK